MDFPMPVLPACSFVKNKLPSQSVPANVTQLTHYRFIGIEPNEPHNETKLILCIDNEFSGDREVTQRQQK